MKIIPHMKIWGILNLSIGLTSQYEGDVEIKILRVN